MDRCYEKFKELLPASSISDCSCISAESSVVEKNLKICRTSAIVFFLLNVYYLITDLVRGFYSTPHALPNLIALLLLIISSLYIFTVSLKKQKDYDNNFTHISILVY